MYNGAQICTKGTIVLKCERKGRVFKIRFLVVKEKVKTIIGCKDSVKCNFIKVLENDCVFNIDLVKD